ncbi:MAG: biotin carboxylase [Gammaproteobacteria bacterium]|nr:biotin carboxylase [Gammaproteobacteria bacterium]NND38919.1 biotin carboxylase [Pseudomonadales bacterium]NNM12376.1 biotin carboxylase [Pseudomonadales bacterium]
MSNYKQNPLVHSNRQRAGHSSAWVASFCCRHLRPLIICRGPIRKEVMDVLVEMGIDDFGILLSEKDSIVYPNALSPELRSIKSRRHVHRVPDYSGASKEERQQRIEQIIKIAHDNSYDSIFAGYGFMAEDEEMVRSMEQAGLNFIGPCSHTVHSAGLKDEAKRTALKVGVSVTPGIDNATALALLRKHPGVAELKQLVAEHQLDMGDFDLDDKQIELADKADAVLAASYAKGVDLYTVAELQEEIRLAVIDMYKRYPENRIRLKAIGGGGGKGQRILPAPVAYSGSDAEKIDQASSKAPEYVLEILNEVKTTGVGDNKNVLVELNIETTRHQEIQVVGNGSWCITMGARDCSLQMHEQKLLEVSSTHESIADSIAAERSALASGAGKQEALAVLEQDLKTLDAMEEEAARFGKAVGLDSVSTFECIVDRGSHFFMEMNTRIQVEHRVTELCYALEFTNPDNSQDSFVVESLVELMVLLAVHGQRLPEPKRMVRKNCSVEARLNATNDALQPHAGGLIGWWNQPHADEIRDDQGISQPNPDTGVFVKYKLAGAYDSNIALLLTHGDDRMDSYERLAEIIRQTRITGEDLSTNLDFHYGLVNWFIGTHIQARPTTKFIVPYLTAVGLLKQHADALDIEHAFKTICKRSADAHEDGRAMYEVVERKHSLILRPISLLFGRPHALAGWLSVHHNAFSLEAGNKVTWRSNPIHLLADLYHFLNMDYHPDRFPQTVIWDHDERILSAALNFYQELESRLGSNDFQQMCVMLEQDNAPGNSNINAQQWTQVQAAHRGFQAGTDALKMIPYLAAQTDFYALDVAPDLNISIPERLLDEELQKSMAKVLAPPPVANANEIIATSGGMFYAREAPGMDVYVQAGDRFEAGDVLYIVEVMKMFNKVTAPFAGTIKKVLVENDGVIIAKGQRLFEIEPDGDVSNETEDEVTARRLKNTETFLACCEA